MPKRAALEAVEPNASALYDEYAQRLEGEPIDMNADQVRRRIRTYLDSGAMKVGEFQNVIGVNSNSWHTFMKQSGPEKGTGSSVFANAWVFFKGREEDGIKMPKKAKVSKAEGPPSVDDIHLDGEDDDSVPIYDHCDEIRRKITAHLKLPGVTQASLCREIAKGFRKEERKIQSKQLADFRSHTGELGGNSSAVFYGAYCYFERLRIKEGKEKTAHRLQTERVEGKKGVTRVREPTHMWVIMPRDMMPRGRRCES